MNAEIEKRPLTNAALTAAIANQCVVLAGLVGPAYPRNTSLLQRDVKHGTHRFRQVNKLRISGQRGRMARGTACIEMTNYYQNIDAMTTNICQNDTKIMGF